MEKIIYAKLDPNIEPPSHETHFGAIPCTSIFKIGLNFLRFVAYENPNMNLN